MKIKLVVAVCLLLIGLYGVSFYSGTKYFYLALVAAIWGGWWVGEAIRERRN